jgi:hypothetical protein
VNPSASNDLGDTPSLLLVGHAAIRPSLLLWSPAAPQQEPAIVADREATRLKLRERRRVAI